MSGSLRRNFGPIPVRHWRPQERGLVLSMIIEALQGVGEASQNLEDKTDYTLQLRRSTTAAEREQLGIPKIQECTR